MKPIPYLIMYALKYRVALRDVLGSIRLHSIKEASDEKTAGCICSVGDQFHDGVRGPVVGLYFRREVRDQWLQGCEGVRLDQSEGLRILRPEVRQGRLPCGVCHRGQ